jgi:hypothetical protein
MRLRLDYQNNTYFPVIGVIQLGVALMALLLVVIYSVNLRNQVDALELKLGSVSSKEHSKVSAASMSEIGRVDLMQEIKNANDVLHHLSVPWDELFKAVESSSGSHVTLLALEPDYDKKQVKISGEANRYKTIMMYISELEKKDEIGSVYLQNHDIRQDDPDRPVRFTLVANWQEK